MSSLCVPSQSQQLAIVPFNQTTNNQPNTICTNPSFHQRLSSRIMEEFQEHYSIERLLRTTFIWIMTTTSISHVVLGFELLEKTGLSNSISPTVMSLFKYSLSIFTSFSLACGNVYSRSCNFFYCLLLPITHFVLSTFAEKYKRIFFYISDVSYMSWMGGFSTTGRHGKHGWLVNFGIYWFLQTVISPIGARISVSSDLVMVISICTSCFRAAMSSHLERLTSFAPSLLSFLDENVKKLLPVVFERVKLTLKEKRKIGKFVKYAIGLVGTLLFQNFFRLTTFNHVKAFIYLSISWLANVALVNASDDLGILNFLLGNMILGSTVSQSGLGITTWFTYGVCLFLYILGIKLKYMNTSQNLERLPRPPIIFWIFYSCVAIDSLFNLINYQINIK